MVQREKVHKLSAITVIGLGVAHMVSSPKAPKPLDHEIIRCRCATSSGPCARLYRSPNSFTSRLNASISTPWTQLSSGARRAARGGREATMDGVLVRCREVRREGRSATEDEWNA